MPFSSKAQSRYFHWAREHPAEAEQRGLKPSVVNEFISAQHGRSEKTLPDHVQHKATGGRYEAPGRGGGYPKQFRW